MWALSVIVVKNLSVSNKIPLVFFLIFNIMDVEHGIEPQHPSSSPISDPSPPATVPKTEEVPKAGTGHPDPRPSDVPRKDIRSAELPVSGLADTETVEFRADDNDDSDGDDYPGPEDGYSLESSGRAWSILQEQQNHLVSSTKSVLEIFEKSLGLNKAGLARLESDTNKRFAGIEKRVNEPRFSAKEEKLFAQIPGIASDVKASKTEIVKLQKAIDKIREQMKKVKKPVHKSSK